MWAVRVRFPSSPLRLESEVGKVPTPVLKTGCRKAGFESYTLRCGRCSMVERLVVVQVCAGSNPVGHPSCQGRGSLEWNSAPATSL